MRLDAFLAISPATAAWIEIEDLDRRFDSIDPREPPPDRIPLHSLAHFTIHQMKQVFQSILALSSEETNHHLYVTVRAMNSPTQIIDIEDNTPESTPFSLAMVKDVAIDIFRHDLVIDDVTHRMLKIAYNIMRPFGLNLIQTNLDPERRSGYKMVPAHIEFEANAPLNSETLNLRRYLKNQRSTPSMLRSLFERHQASAQEFAILDKFLQSAPRAPNRGANNASSQNAPSC